MYPLQDELPQDKPVINLSGFILSSSDISVLSKGLGFVSNYDFDVFSTLLDVNHFAHLLTIKNHFFKANMEDTTQASSSLQENHVSNPNEHSNRLTKYDFGDLCVLSQ